MLAALNHMLISGIFFVQGLLIKGLSNSTGGEQVILVLLMGSVGANLPEYEWPISYVVE